MPDLASDPRTSGAFSRRHQRLRVKGLIFVPVSEAPCTERLLSMLPADAEALWIGWARQDRGLRRHQFLCLLTETTLHGAVSVRDARAATTQVWSQPAGTWEAGVDKSDLIVTMPSGKPLRLPDLDAGEMALFGYVAAPVAAPAGHALTSVPSSPPADPSPVGSSASWRGPAAPGATPALPDLTVPDPSDVAPSGPLLATWQAAEQFAAWHMRELGFTDAQTTPPGNDRGLDVVSEQGVAQVKHYNSGAIGGPTVQQLKGAAAGRPWALFYALSGYTRAATEFADAAHVALFTYTVEGAVTPSNAAATYLLDQADGVPDVEEYAAAQQLSDLYTRYYDVCVQKMSQLRPLVEGSLRAGDRRPGDVWALEMQRIVRIGNELNTQGRASAETVDHQLQEVAACLRRTIEDLRALGVLRP